MSSLNLTHHFLIATPALDDIYFHKSLIYIFNHSDQGALGVVINKKSIISMGEIMEQQNINNIKKGLFSKKTFFGGPVNRNHGFVMHDSGIDLWQGTFKTQHNIKITSSKDILIDIANDNLDANFIVGLGYSGWDNGQLEKELGENIWLSCPADNNIIFMENNEDKLEKACNLLGINWSNLSRNIGHA